MGRLIAVIWFVAIGALYLLPRSEFYTIWCLYSLAFGGYAWLVFSGQPVSLRTGIWLAVGIRLLSFWFTPTWSDDYFRFIWDGMLWGDGIHPMAYTPDELMRMPDTPLPDTTLYPHLNHTAYYSVYPPVAQGIYTLSFAINQMHIGGHILFLKSIALLADVGIFYLLFLLLRKFGLPTRQVLVYALNPLVIMEFTGNLHPDNLMIAGLLFSILLTGQGKTRMAGMMMAVSILSKLVTAMLVPFMPVHSYKRRIFEFGGIAFAVSAVALILFFGHHTGWLKSVGLWFTSFEFNAGLYYLARFAGEWIWGYNRIALIGPFMAGVSLIGIGMLWWQYAIRNRINWSSAMVYVLTVYLLLGTTIHPWYTAMLLVLGILARFSYPIVWTYLVVLSYSHYYEERFEEQYILIATEYILLLVWMAWELQGRLKKEKPV